MRILYYGPIDGNGGSRFRGMQLLGHEVESVFERDPIHLSGRIIRGIESRLYNGPVTMKVNKVFLQRAKEFEPNLLWVEMGRSIYASTLKKIKERFNCLLVNSYSDDFIHKHSRHYNKSIPLYDYIFTPRKVNYSDYYKLGAKAVGFFWKGYAPENHFPVEVTAKDREYYGSEVSFVGHCEPSTIEIMCALREVFQTIKIWGAGWDRYRLPSSMQKVVQFKSVWYEEYRKVLCGSNIIVHYLSRRAQDTQTSKSFEIPACGAFMLTERTEEHIQSFEEDKEAGFFSSAEELVKKVRFYLKNNTLREQIATAGRERCLRSGYSNHERIKKMLDEVLEHNDRMGK
jgi:hypothetical protein